MDVPVHCNDHITAAALRADRERVQEAGRWLVRHSPDQCSTIIGLALLAADWNKQDIDLIKHIGLLSGTFYTALAARCSPRGLVVDANEVSVRHNELAIGRGAGDDTPETLHVRLAGRMRYGRLHTPLAGAAPVTQPGGGP
ncbi:hypothetical protein ACQPZP_22325 [Spirillospora sp. CA-142024]|uniref:hypothetical protein n=1 Tax=Spirillospora sp. CA-142024 TaxID=3240036 RepID=UPI003D8B554F